MAMGERQGECRVCSVHVIRCAHFAGQILWLTDGSVHNCGTILERFGVQLGDEIEPCSEGVSQGVSQGVSHLWGWSRPFITDDLPAAEAEFAKREATLLGREVPA